MSLVRLLTTGKSLVGIKETTSRYHLARQNWLPKFASAKNPFASTVTADRDSVPGQTPANDAAKSAATIAALKKTQRLPLYQSPTKVVQASEGAPRRTGSAKFAGKWLSALNPFSLKVAGKPKPVSGARSAPAVQGELSLDKVKVVRNDLSDADLEIVPLRSSTGKASAGAAPGDERPPTIAGAKAPANANALERLASSLFGGERAQVH